jgi:hypothetical protein
LREKLCLAFAQLFYSSALAGALLRTRACGGLKKHSAPAAPQKLAGNRRAAPQAPTPY